MWSTLGNFIQVSMLAAQRPVKVFFTKTWQSFFLTKACQSFFFYKVLTKFVFDKGLTKFFFWQRPVKVFFWQRPVKVFFDKDLTKFFWQRPAKMARYLCQYIPIWFSILPKLDLNPVFPNSIVSNLTNRKCSKFML